VDPSNIPDRVELDITSMVIGDSKHVSDLPIPPGVEVQDDPETSVAVLAAPRAVIEEVAPVAEPVEGEVGAVGEPEVIGRGKEEEEGEEGEAPKKGEPTKK
jgi:large subunit ribosomal protein L25